MQFRDLKAQYTALQPEIDAAMQKVASDSNFISGTQVTELETALAEYVGTTHCVSCGNGTDALTMLLMGWNIGAGDAVFVPDFTFFASGEVVSYAGATPVFVDVDAHTFNLDADKLEEAICNVRMQGKLTPKAVIAVDLFGLPADYRKIESIAKKYDLLLLEDGAQGFGGSMDGRRACSFGDAATTSFFPAKPLGCYGDGGAIFTNDTKLADYLRSIRVHGKGSYKYDNVRIGLNSRLDTLQAAILQPKFEAFKRYELTDVNAAAARYTAELQDVVKTPVIPEGFYSSWAQYTITLRNRAERDDVQQTLKEQGIPTMVYYPKPMHAQTAFADLAYQKGSCPVTEMLCDCVLSLPMHPYLTKQDTDQVCSALKQALKQR